MNVDVQIAVKLVPDSTSLMRILMSKQENNSNDNLNKEIRTLVSLLVPVLQEIHNVLVINYYLPFEMP